MPTPAERKALVFLSALLLVGMAVRARAAEREPIPPPDAQARVALHRQIAAVDSAKREGATRRRRRGVAAPRSPAIAPGSGLSQVPDSVPQRRIAIATVLPSSIDLDVAPATDIERLPRIGMSLAKRIVADRDSLGPFGSLERFQRVRGVGPSLAKAVAPYVTFSLQPRPTIRDDGSRGASATRRRRRLPKALDP